MPNYDDAIKAFTFMKNDREEYQNSKNRVSLADIYKNEAFEKHCDWAINQLKILKGSNKPSITRSVEIVKNANNRRDFCLACGGGLSLSRHDD